MSFIPCLVSSESALGEGSHKPQVNWSSRVSTIFCVGNYLRLNFVMG